ncbi:MAG: hypothetical protein NTX91_00870 [candidate division SR1 bacterium]|nr:hypothetical protein [candidate division SR1 bacterium]
MKPKGNISILVIFVLLASSLLGVLAMNFVQSMMKQSATVYNYYQSYYLAKAGVELSLAELGHRGIGFEQTFSDASFLSGNFICAGRCSLSVGLSGMTTHLSQQFQTQSIDSSVTACQFPFVVSGGQSFILPLFQDNFIGSLTDGFTTSIVYTNLYGALAAAEIQTSNLSQVTFGMVVLSGNDLADNGIFFQTGDIKGGLPAFLTSFDTYFRNISALTDISREDISPYRFFFMISNSHQEPISFCLAGPQALPTQQYYIQSQGTYDHQTLGLEAVYKQPIPDFLLNGYLNF